MTQDKKLEYIKNNAIKATKKGYEQGKKDGCVIAPNPVTLGPCKLSKKLMS